MREMGLCKKCGMCWKPVDTKCIRCGFGFDHGSHAYQQRQKRAGICIVVVFALLAIVMSAITLVSQP